MRRLECLDGLRGLLALYVLLSHMAPFAAAPGWMARPFLHGGAAVDLFFILSGMVIIRSLESFGYWPRPFLVARVGRIFPVFLVVFPLAVAVQPLPIDFEHMPWISPGGAAQMTWSDDWPATWMPEIAAHLTLMHGLFPDGILPNAWVSFLGSAWSLSTEWQFYLLIAAVACSVPRRGGGQGLAWMFLGVAGLALGFQLVAPGGWQFSRAFLPNKAQYFALGIAATDLQAAPGRPALRRYAVILACTLVLCGLQGGANKMIAPLVWSACLAAELAPSAPGLCMLARLLRSRLLLWLGALSYCVYLVNEPIQKLLGVTLAHVVHGDAVLFTAIWLPAATLLPIGIAWVLHRTVEPAGQAWGRVASRRLMVSGA